VNPELQYLLALVAVAFVVGYLVGLVSPAPFRP